MSVGPGNTDPWSNPRRWFCQESAEEGRAQRHNERVQERIQRDRGETVSCAGKEELGRAQVGGAGYASSRVQSPLQLLPPWVICASGLLDKGD